MTKDTTKAAALTAAEKALADAQAEVNRILDQRQSLVAIDLAERDHGAVGDANDRLRAACLRRDQRQLEVQRIRDQGPPPAADFEKFQKLRREAQARHTDLMVEMDRVRDGRDRIGTLRAEIDQAETEAEQKTHSFYDYADYARGGHDRRVPDNRARLAALWTDLAQAERELENALVAQREAGEAWHRAKVLVDAGEAAIRALPGGAAVLRELPDPRFAGAPSGHTPPRSRLEVATN